MTVELNVNVQVGITPEVASLLAGLLNTGKAASQAASEQPGAEAQAPVAKKPRKTKAQPAEAQDAAPAAEAAQEAEQPAEAEAAQEAEQPAEDPTEEDVRAAMHRTRQRIEGEDYKENTDGELYKKFHKQLTGEFKRLASLLGADKPSALDADKRAQFIAACEDLFVGTDGVITTKVPF